MEGYEITTAHNVKLKLGFASLGDRLLAYMIDSLIKGGYIVAMIFTGVMISSMHLSIDSVTIFGVLASTTVLVPIFYFLRRKSTTGHFILLIQPLLLILLRVAMKDISTVFWVFAIVIGMLPYVFYSLFFEYFMEGQTPGKRVRQIKVASQDSSELTLGQCMIRWLFRLVDFGVFSGAIAMVTIAVTDRKQRVGDLVAGTIVVSLKTEKTLDQTIYAYVAPDRPVRYPLAARLTAREIEVIKEVIRLNNEEGKHDLVPMTATRVRATVGAGVETDDLSLLQTVIEDYYTLAAQ